MKLTVGQSLSLVITLHKVVMFNKIKHTIVYYQTKNTTAYAYDPMGHKRQSKLIMVFKKCVPVGLERSLT